MEKFAIECPHCGTLNQASTFVFAKRIIECGHCKQSIDVKANRLVSRKCTNCDSVFLYDQKKGTDVCPVCKERVSAKQYSFDCPQCGCVIEASENELSKKCPICDYQIADVRKEIEKSRLVSDNGISVIKYEGTNDTFVWKHPIEDFNLGSQLIVHESQEAIFFMNGQALDTFGPGRYALETESLPVLKKIQSLPTGKQSPFHAEVYFINKTIQMNQRWGVGDIKFKVPNYDIVMKFGMSGTMNLQVSDSRKLLVKLVGTTQSITWDHGESVANTLREMFKPHLISVVKSSLPAIIKEENIDILELDENVEMLAERLREKVSAGLEEYGLWIPQLQVNNFALPEDDPNFKTILAIHTENMEMRKIEHEKKMKLAQQEANLEVETGALAFNRLAEEKAKIAVEGAAEREKIKAESQAEISKLEAEMDKIKAEAQATKIRMEGLAEAEVAEAKAVAEGRGMAAQGYTKKDEFAKDAQVAWAHGVGQMGSNGGGGNGGGMMSEVVSMGAAMATLGVVSEKMSGAMKGIAETDPATQDNPTVPGVPQAGAFWTCACGYANNSGKFCAECGAPKPEAWDCPKCGAKGNKGKFCSECGAPKPEAWDCPHCGTKGNKGKFCSECGKAKDAVPDTWNCSCGQQNITGKFCPECGAKKEDDNV